MSSVYQKKALEKLESPEQLDRLIIVTPPMTWLVIVSVSIMTVAFLLWGIFGTIIQFKEIKGVTAGGGLNEIIAFVPVDEMDALRENGSCSIRISSGQHTGKEVFGTVDQIESQTVTSEKAGLLLEDEALGSWIVKDIPMRVIHIVPEDDCQFDKGEMADIQIVVSEDHPYQLVF